MSLLHAFLIADEWIELNAKSSAEQGRPITCRGQGCYSCCKEPVLCSREEAEYCIALLSPEQTAVATEATRQWLTQVQGAGILKEPIPHVYFWRALNAWCPLLSNGQCMAYQNRPFGCRSHQAIGDPDLCKTDDGRLSQIYATSVEADAYGMFAITEACGGSIEVDNLGVWLAELLLGRFIKSAARQTLSLTLIGATLQMTYH